VLDHASVVLLGGVAAGLIEGMDASQIVVEIDVPLRSKFHPCGLHEAAKLPHAPVHQTNACQHFVDVTAEPFEHASRLRKICRFSKDSPFKRNHGIHAKDDAVRKSRSNFNGLEFCIQEA
jgi:hypothetical protein